MRQSPSDIEVLQTWIERIHHRKPQVKLLCCGLAKPVGLPSQNVLPT
jgi:hypothetical protein